MRVKGVEKLFLFLRGYPEISQTNEGSKSTITTVNFMHEIQILQMSSV